MIHQKDCLHLSLDDLGGRRADLIYMDPPFGEGGTYSLSDGAFCYSDSFPSNSAEHRWYNANCDPCRVLWPDEADMSHGYDWGIWLVHRVYHLRKLLSPTGTFVLHVSPLRSHLVRLAMDKLFGWGCFRNEVIWRYRRRSSPSRDYQRMHDVLLVYSKDPSTWTFNQLYEPLAESTLKIKTFKGRKQRADFSSGKRKPSVDPEESKGALLSDVWDIGVVPPSGKERTGCPTQKPEALLERVILSRSNPGDLVLDPSCGSGTTLAVAQRTGRVWVGCDIGEVACRKSRVRLGLYGQALESKT